MIVKNQTKADRILTRVSKLTGETKLRCEPYQNGREHGWSVYSKNLQKQIAFSESRHSYKIVVYFGATHQFDCSGNAPSDAIYRAARFFAPKDYDGAAIFIVDFLTKE